MKKVKKKLEKCKGCEIGKSWSFWESSTVLATLYLVLGFILAWILSIFL